MKLRDRLRQTLLVVLMLLGFAGLVILSPFLLVIFLSIPDSILNNVALSHFSQQLFTYPLPPDSRLVTKNAEVTLLGNSNHCDFVAEMTLASNLTELELKAYYEPVTFAPARSERQGSEDFFADGLHSDLQARVAQLGELVDGTVQYSIKLVDFGYPPGWDFRCH